MMPMPLDTDPQPRETVDINQIASMAGLTRSRIQQFKKASLDKHHRGEVLGPLDLPLPITTRKARMGGRRAVLWRESEIEVWLEARGVHEALLGAKRGRKPKGKGPMPLAGQGQRYAAMYRWRQRRMQQFQQGIRGEK
jgi:predicted DNA-binding transcriptional regulator AlpA